MKTGTFKTKMSDDSQFTVERIVTSKSKTGYVVNTAWGHYNRSKLRNVPLDCERIDFNKPINET